MISYDYKIVRDEKDEIKIYSPSMIPKKLENITYIEGPNSSGKSTLLNILAIGFHGIKNKKIIPILKTDMNNLFNSKHQAINFSFTIKIPDQNLELVSEGDSKGQKIDFFEVINGKRERLTSEAFERKYKLIYDIPDKPRERIKLLLKEIQEFQWKYGENVLELKNYIRKVISDIKSSKDPNKEKELIEKINNFTKEKDKVDKEKESKETELGLLESSVYYEFLQKYEGLCSDIDEDIEKTTKEYAQFKKKFRKDKKDYDEISKTTRLLFLDFKKKFDDFTKDLEIILPSKEKHHLSRWQRINLLECFGDCQFPKTLHECLSTFDKIINSVFKEKEEEESAKEAEMVEGLLHLLEGYKDFNFKIPGMGKTVKEFIIDLQKLEKEMKSVISYTECLNRSVNLVDELKENIKRLENEQFPELIKLKEEDKKYSKDFSKVRVLENKISSLKEEEDEFREKHKFYKKNFERIGEPLPKDIVKIGRGTLKVYANLNEDRLLDEIDSIGEEIKNLQRQIAEKDRLIDRLKYDLQKLKGKKPHEFRESLEALNNLDRVATIMDSKLRVTFKAYLEDLTSGETIGNEDISEDQNNYNQAIFKYLGKRLGKIRHIDAEYTPVNVNLNEGCIDTKSGKRIMLSDMGTGQSQSAYLSGLLNTSDDRKIIALFDEVAHMDNSSLNPIYTKFRELYKKKKLVLGIVVQKAEKLKVISKL